jgi:CBS domain-containing protein
VNRSSDQTASRRFLDAFAAIEKHLQNRSHEPAMRRATFYELVDAIAKVDAAVRRYQIDLKEYADLRNAIVHERIGGEPIAEPHMQTVVALEAILRLITAPPKLASVFSKAVIVCSPEEPVSSAARKMRRGNFSQLPVVENRIAAMLTGETIARWLADSWETMRLFWARPSQKYYAIPRIPITGDCSLPARAYLTPRTYLTISLVEGSP